jgi:PKD repeat protein
MKRLYLFFVLPIFIISCSKKPEANFFIEIDKAKVGSEVFFRNTSDNAERYEWDFGDGTYSSKENPVHVYKTVGRYSVTLTASKNSKESKAMIVLDVVEPTLLVVEVVEYYEMYSVGNASVILYPTLNDWDKQTRAIVEGFTDNDGIVVFGGLNPGIHYVDVWEKNHDNYQLADEDTWFIEADVLRDKVQWFTAYVDYYSSKGDTRGEKRMVVKKVEKREPGKTYQGAYNGEIDYEALLKKSVIKE